MVISLLVAASNNNTIGRNNQLPWHLPNDLRFFKNTTWGMPIVMGRKTFESVNKPLKGRINIIVTGQQNWNADGVIVAHDLNSAFEEAEKTNCKEVFVIGGRNIFKQAMNTAHRIYLTRINAVIEGDVFLPVLDQNDWQLVSNDDFKADDKHAYDYSFQMWMRKN